ncbi:hypothetical protein COK19_12790 [Bacillus cereus]|uniref:HamA C-terminal domain-containing protein n=1 Tax=Bacillus cereus TaxID=1396 RepID=UPI000BFA2615|nr:DUF1837 domain-containing protein [Bacillus cereus]PFR26497.1 hypothetical protein COK19_12790 [Bacillus cereus]
MLHTEIGNQFLDLFYHDIKDYSIDGCNTNLNLHTLKISNNKFAYYDLVDALEDCIVTYCLSAKELEKLKENVGKKYTRAVRKLRNYKANDGELGEILLYCMLESHLKAPKIFTKMELKTSSEDYVKGADGVHLLKLDDCNYQIIFGESKLNQKFQRGLYEAFKSIKEYITRANNNINDELVLINSYLEKEAVSEEMYSLLKSILVPSARESEINTDNAFGIFVGFELDLDEADWKLSNRAFREKVRNLIKESVEKEFKYIKKKVEEHQLYGYDFYIYVIPFFELDETRKRVIKNLKVAENDF